MTLGIHAQNCYSDIFCHDSKHMLHPSINMLFNPTSAFISGNHRIFINVFFFATIIKNVDSSHCKRVITIFELLKGKLKVKSSLIEKYSFKYLYWVTMLNIFLIVITAPAIVNSGPKRKLCCNKGNKYATNIKHLNVAYCNAGGFITTTSMSGVLPIFKDTKLLEFQSYIYKNKPDIVIVNESWLNEYINNN